MGKVDSLKICGACKAHCCKYGGTTATKQEVDRIVKAGFENHFERISDNAYITPWGTNGVCPYLVHNACSIHDVRPKLCKGFPVLKADGKNTFYLQQCPLSKSLTKNDINTAKELLKTVPAELIDASNEYNKQYEKVFAKRFTKYKTKKID